MIGRRRIAARYGAGAHALGLAGLISPPVSLVLLWPAFAVALVAAAYGGLGPGVLGKRAGRLAWGRRLLLAPYLAGANASLRLQSRGHPPYVEVVPGLFLGRRLSAQEARRLPVTAVLDLTAELSEAASLRRRAYHCLPTLDLTVPEPAQLAEGARFIEAQLPQGRSTCTARLASAARRSRSRPICWRAARPRRRAKPWPGSRRPSPGRLWRSRNLRFS